MSADFIDEAIDTLSRGPENRFIVIAWLRDSARVRRAGCLTSKEQVEFVRAELNKMLDEAAEALP